MSDKPCRGGATGHRRSTPEAPVRTCVKVLAGGCASVALLSGVHAHPFRFPILKIPFEAALCAATSVARADRVDARARVSGAKGGSRRAAGRKGTNQTDRAGYAPTQSPHEIREGWAMSVLDLASRGHAFVDELHDLLREIGRAHV